MPVEIIARRFACVWEMTILAIMKNAIFPLLTIIFMLASSCREEVLPVSPELDMRVEREDAFTGRGNISETLLTLSIYADSAYTVSSIDVRLEGGSANASALGLVCDGRLMPVVAVNEGQSEYNLPCGECFERCSEIRVCADIREDAPEGGRISADITGVNLPDTTLRPKAPKAAFREILLRRICLYKPGDFGSKYWRIPTIRQLQDSTLLVVNDRRNDTENDLPETIDVVYRYSTDGGRTWSEPGCIARNRGKMFGFGDPGLIETEDGTVICTFTGGERFARSCKENPQRSYFAISKDHGHSWGEPQELTEQIWGSQYHSSFFTSGNGLLLTRGDHKGRILVANVAARGPRSVLHNHAVYSDDGGRTWNVSAHAFGGGADEAKLVQLKDGRVLLTSRQPGLRPYVISDDGGQTWGPVHYWENLRCFNCNGDIIRYDDDVLLFSAPTSDHWKDISVFYSLDEGKTWSDRKVIHHGPSMYSSLTVLKDGTVGVYFEKNRENCELWFENVSLDWLMTREEKCTVHEGVRLWAGGPEWATCNIGADSPYEAGEYFSWAETRSKGVHGWTSYKYCNGNERSITKYCDADEKGLLEYADYAAYMNWRNGWHIPRKADWEDLKKRCRWEWTEMGDTLGYLVTGENGNSIFLPATGYVSGTTFKEYDYFGYYWSANRDMENPHLAWDFYFQSEYCGCFRGGRDNGRCVRPVRY